MDTRKLEVVVKMANDGLGYVVTPYLPWKVITVLEVREHCARG